MEGWTGWKGVRLSRRRHNGYTRSTSQTPSVREMVAKRNHQRDERLIPSYIFCIIIRCFYYSLFFFLSFFMMMIRPFQKRDLSDLSNHSNQSWLNLTSKYTNRAFTAFSVNVIHKFHKFRCFNYLLFFIFFLDSVHFKRVLSDLWNHSNQSGLNLSFTDTNRAFSGFFSRFDSSADEDAVDNLLSVDNLIRFHTCLRVFTSASLALCFRDDDYF